MNKTTAKKIHKLIDKINDITSELTEIRDELQEKWDNMSEARQESDKGQELETEIANLDDLITDLEYADEARPELEE